MTKRGLIASMVVFLAAAVVVVVLGGCSHKQTQVGEATEPVPVAEAPAPSDWAGFDRWGITFEYPKDWEEYPSDRTEEMKNFLADEAGKFGLDIEEFTVFADPSGQSTALMVIKYTRDRAIKPSELVEERMQVYKSAQQAGDVTKINFVRPTSVAKLPAVEEDVERSNGGRGRTYKIISGKTIYEISFVVNDGSSFDSYSEPLKHILSTASVRQ